MGAVVVVRHGRVIGAMARKPLRNELREQLDAYLRAVRHEAEREYRIASTALQRGDWVRHDHHKGSAAGLRRAAWLLEATILHDDNEALQRR